MCVCVKVYHRGRGVEEDGPRATTLASSTITVKSITSVYMTMIVREEDEEVGGGLGLHIHRHIF